MQNKAIIIGAGISGLATAIRLKCSGIQVDVFEKNDGPGGKVRELNKDGYRFDMGPSLFTLPELVEELFELCDRKMADYFTYQSLDASCKYVWPDGTCFNAWNNRDKFDQEVDEKFIDDSENVIRFLKRQKEVYEGASGFFLFQSIHKLKSYLTIEAKRSLAVLPRLDFWLSMNKRNKKAFKNDKLVQLFNRYATYNGSNPYRAPATLNMIAHLEHNKGAYFPKKGMYSIVAALFELAKDVGVRFHFNQSVQKIKIAQKRVEGVVIDNVLVPARWVVSGVDVDYLNSDILAKKKMRLKKLQRSSSAIIFYWGMKKSWKKLDVHNIFFSKFYRDEFDHLFKFKKLANDLTVYLFISSKVVKGDAPEGCENWYVMVNAPEYAAQDRRGQKDSVRKIVLEKIGAHLKEDINKCIETETYIDQVDIEKATASVNGALYGMSSNSLLSAFLRHPNFNKGIKNLYHVGGSVHPGGGIPLCLASAKIVDQLIQNEWLENKRKNKK